MRQSDRAVTLEAAANELAAADAGVTDLLVTHGVPDLARGRGSAFTSLARAICFQQLAGAAAATIWGRFRGLVDGPLRPAGVLALSEEEMRGAGLSGAKARSIRDLAEHADDGRLPLRSLSRLGDDEVVARLTVVRGIGEWTAQMFLLGHLARLDVWPTGDLGVRKGFALTLGNGSVPDPDGLDAAGERYRPYRSLIAWWCWRATDTWTPD